MTGAPSDGNTDPAAALTRAAQPDRLPPHVRDDGHGRRPLDFDPDDEDQWHRLARGYRLSGLLLGAHRLGLLRALADGPPRPVGQLARDLFADHRLVLTMCRALRVAGLLRRRADGWTLSAAGQRIAGDTAANLELDAMAEDYHRWGQLDQHARALLHDDRADPRAYDDSGVTTSEAAARRYARRMTSRRRQQVTRMLDGLTPTRDVTVLDAWGGDGYVARHISTHWPLSTCTVIEIPTMAATTRQACAGHPRIAVVTGDLLTDDPGAALDGDTVDVVVLSHVLQSLPQRRRRELVVQVARLLAPGGCLLSNEFVLRWDDEDSLDVLLWAVGRTADNWRSRALEAAEQDLLVRAAGLAATRSWWVTEATRAVLAVKPAAGVQPALRTRPTR